MTTRRSFLAALFTPAIARLALAAGRQPKLLPRPWKTGTMNEVLDRVLDRRLRIAHTGIETEQKRGHLYVRHFDALGKEHWKDLGEVTSMRLG
jgi:hypothetical protein